MNLRRLSCLLPACILCFICSTAVYALPRCKTGDSLTYATGWLNFRPHPPGIFNIRFAMVNFYAPTNPSSTMRGVIQEAMWDWNLKTCYTGMFFIPMLGVIADIDFIELSTDSAAQTGNCITYKQIQNGIPVYDIVYGPAFKQRLAMLPAVQTKAAISHELGHVLGLDHTIDGSASIMFQPSSCTESLAVTSVTYDDANTAGECLNSTPDCPGIILFTTWGPVECQQQGGHWNFTIGGCFPTPQPNPCVDCVDLSDCCDGDVCHEGVCGPPEVYCPDCCPECPPDTVCFEGFCSYCTPILIDVEGDGFRLTDAAGGVDFNFAGDGVRRRLPWTAVGSDDAWLVFDRNHNGKIDTGLELFGNMTPQTPAPQQERNGFLALAEFDKPASGGNDDGEISRHDFIFPYLQLWTDANHNGISEPAELKRLGQTGVRILELDYKISNRVDQFGNQFRYRAKVKDARGAQLGRWAWDVIFGGGTIPGRGKKK